MSHLARYAKTLQFVVDLVTMIMGYFSAYWVASVEGGHRVFPYARSTFYETEALCYLAWALALAVCAEYPSRRKSGVAHDLSSVITTNLSALLVFSVSAFILKEVSVSRRFIFSYVLTMVVLMFLNRYLVRTLLYLLRQAGWDTHTRVIVGANENAERYLDEVHDNRRFGLQVLGFVSTNRQGWDPDLMGVPCLGSIDHLEEILTSQAPDGVVVALNITDPQIEQVMHACEVLGVSVELLLDGLSSKIASSAVHHGARFSSLHLSAIPHTPPSLLIKRMTDLVMSAVALVVLAPLFLSVAIAIKLEDGGPVWFVQERVGLHNKPFRMYKLRSMRVGAEALQASLHHLNEMSGPVFKITQDPRITRVGAFIRRTSIDELPQLFNVLIGNMSVVGPRPPLPSEVDRYADIHRRRLSVKPGLTCLWQIAGRNNIDFDRWMALDLAYIDNWSYLGDVKIIFQTIPAVLKRSGAR